MDFDYTVTTEKSFEEAVKAVESETESAGFRILYIHDVTATLKEKDLEIEPFKIIEICNAKSAYTVLQADTKIGLCLPCKIKELLIGANNTRNSSFSPLMHTRLHMIFQTISISTKEIDSFLSIPLPSRRKKVT